MGTWGLGTFDDDIACDWLEDLCESDPRAFFAHCLDLTGLDDLEYLACIGVVCTAEMIHAVLRTPREGLPEFACQWAARHADLNFLPMVPDAIRGIDRVLEPQSEMHQLWEDNEEMYDCWKCQVQDLHRNLQSILVENV